jgi:uncharacterized protein (TIGR04551 family)
MKRVAQFAVLAGALTLAATRSARATGFTDDGADLRETPQHIVTLTGYYRLRLEALEDLDLSRGPTPSGQLLYPAPIADSTGHTLTRGDMRLRTDLAVYAPGGGLAVKARIDSLDNLALGSDPEGIPAGTTSEQASSTPIRVKRVYGEALTPFGLFVAGRMGSQWGLGILTNGGDCTDCDSGDAVDRVGFIMPLLGHLFAAAYDFSATGPFVPDRTGTRSIDFAPSADVHTVTFAMLRYHDAEALARRKKAGLLTFDYGGYFSHRWQNNDIPATYLPTAQPVPIDAQQVMMRGYSANAFDVWLRFEAPGVRVEAEGAWLTARVAQPSLIPGVLLHDAVTSNQLGGALESDFGLAGDAFSAGLDAGYASGDSAPGFGAFPEVNAPAPKAGDLDGPQANPPYDDSVNNFRFHPDYHVDRILFREIIGTVTDAVYFRPHARLTVFHATSGTLEAKLAAIGSFAVNAQSPPGQKRPLGVEVDPTLAYASSDGFDVALEQGTLFPLAGLDNPELGLKAQPAQIWRLRFIFLF